MKLSLRSQIISINTLIVTIGAGIVGLGIHLAQKTANDYAHVSEVNLPNAESLGHLSDFQKRITVDILLLDDSRFQDSQRIKDIEEHVAGYEKIDQWYQSIPFVEGEDAKYQPVAKSWKGFKGVVDSALSKKELDRQQLLNTSDEFEKAIANLIKFQSDEGKKWSLHAKETDAQSFFIQLVALGVLVVVSLGIGFTFSQMLAGKITRVTNQLTSNADEVTSASSQIAASAQQLSQAVTEQASSLQETTASLEEITSMISKATENANTTSDTSNESQKKAEEGRRSVDQMLSSIDEISQSNEAILVQISEGNRQMGEIVKIIQDIGNRTKVINDIVFQTKLLSFNASVEAARAGENGKGFAVVAEEIGTLAQMSGNAAKEITQMLETSTSKVESIARDTQQKVESLVLSAKEKVGSGVNVAKQCSSLLNEIVQNVSKVAGLSQEISHASREQLQGVSEINKAMSQLDTVTQQNAVTSEEAARSSEALSAQADSLKASVEELAAVIHGKAKPLARVVELQPLQQEPSPAILAKHG